MCDKAMMDNYARWKQRAIEDPDLLDELKSIAGQDEEILDRFYRELAFGTRRTARGNRCGENRMNIYTVRKATQGLADYLNASGSENAVAISFDSRIKSPLFAREAARCSRRTGSRCIFLMNSSPRRCFPSQCVRCTVRRAS